MTSQKLLMSLIAALLLSAPRIASAQSAAGRLRGRGRQGGHHAEQQGILCAGRERLDAANPARENVFPGYKEGPDVKMKVGVLRIGDVNFVSLNGEAYSEIGMKVKASSPANKTIFVGLANGMANSGYIYSDAAYSHLTFQVIGSRLKPGCAEGKIVSTAVDLMHKAFE